MGVCASLVTVLPAHATSIRYHSDTQKLSHSLSVSELVKHNPFSIPPPKNECAIIEPQGYTTTFETDYGTFEVSVILEVPYQKVSPFAFCGYVISYASVIGPRTCSFGSIRGEIAIRNAGIHGGNNPSAIQYGTGFSVSDEVPVAADTAVTAAGDLNVVANYIGYSGGPAPDWYTIPTNNG